MARESLDIELNVDADQAKRELDGVADAIDDLQREDVEVPVEADTTDALSNIERFEQQLEGLSDDAIELRVEFRQQLLQGEIRKLLRQIEAIEDDPIELEAKTQDLERAQSDLRELADLADKRYDIEVNADPKRTARRAADDVEDMRQRGEGLQSAIPALRGFTDELGGAAAGAGIASQAVADLGDFSLILGEQLGVSESLTTKLGTALGFAGLAGVVVGAAVPAVQLLSDLLGSQGLNQQTQNAISSLNDLSGVVERLREISEGDALLTAFLGDEDEERIQEVADALGKLGVEIGDLPDVLQAFNTRNNDFIANLAEDAGLTREVAEAVAEASDGVDGWQNIRSRLAEDGFGNELAANGDQIERVSNLLETLENVAQGVDLDVAFEDAARAIDPFIEGEQEAIRLAEQGQITWEEAYGRLLELLNDTSSARDEENRRTAEQLDLLRRIEERYGGVNDEIGGAILAAEEWGRTTEGAAGDAEDSIDDVSSAYDRLRQNLSDRQTYLQLQTQFDRVRDKAVEAWTKTAEGAEDAEQAQRDYQLELLKTLEDTADYLAKVLEIPESRTTKIIAALDGQSVEQVEATLRALQTPLSVPLDVVVNVVNRDNAPIPALPGFTGTQSSGNRQADASASSWQRRNGNAPAPVRNVI